MPQKLSYYTIKKYSFIAAGAEFFLKKIKNNAIYLISFKLQTLKKPNIY